MNILTTIVVAALTVLIAEIIKHFVSVKTSATTKQQDIIKEQKYHYYLPFKYQAEELLNRSIHIEQRLTDNITDMIAHFQVDYEGKPLEWYFKDWINVEERESGGYFLTSTIYMNCILYSKMYLMQNKFPYIEIGIQNSLNRINKNDDNFKRYSEAKPADVIQKENTINNWINLQGENINLKRIVQAIRTSTIMRHGEGIPYGLHYSFGDFVSTEKGIINYEEFCQMLMNKEKRVKFLPLINFWTGLVSVDQKVNQKKMDKLRTLIIALKLVEVSNLK